MSAPCGGNNWGFDVQAWAERRLREKSGNGRCGWINRMNWRLVGNRVVFMPSKWSRPRRLYYKLAIESAGTRPASPDCRSRHSASRSGPTLRPPRSNQRSPASIEPGGNHREVNRYTQS
jgi:hypothetical protein